MYNLAAASKSTETHGVCGGTVKERIYEFVTSRNDREALPIIHQQYGCLNKSRSTTPRHMLTWKQGKILGQGLDVDKELEVTKEY